MTSTRPSLAKKCKALLLIDGTSKLRINWKDCRCILPHRNLSPCVYFKDEAASVSSTKAYIYTFDITYIVPNDIFYCHHYPSKKFNVLGTSGQVIHFRQPLSITFQEEPIIKLTRNRYAAWSLLEDINMQVWKAGMFKCSEWHSTMTARKHKSLLKMLKKSPFVAINKVVNKQIKEAMIDIKFLRKISDILAFFEWFHAAGMFIK